MTFCSPFKPFSFNSPRASANTEMHDDFMPYDSPTSISPCRTMIISYSWMIFSKKLSRGWSFALAVAFVRASLRLS